MSHLKDLPSVDHLLNSDTANELVNTFGRLLTLEAIRSTLNEVRTKFPETATIPNTNSLFDKIQQLLTSWTAPTLLPVINATGVILHTNLGRAPLSYDAMEAIRKVSSGYSNLEYELGKGRRGSRAVHAGDLLVHLTGAEAALVVNNNAAAVLLVLTA